MITPVFACVPRLAIISGLTNLCTTKQATAKSLEHSRLHQAGQSPGFNTEAGSRDQIKAVGTKTVYIDPRYS